MPRPLCVPPKPLKVAVAINCGWLWGEDVGVIVESEACDYVEKLLTRCQQSIRIAWQLLIRQKGVGIDSMAALL